MCLITAANQPAVRLTWRGKSRINYLIEATQGTMKVKLFYLLIGSATDFASAFKERVKTLFQGTKIIWFYKWNATMKTFVLAFWLKITPACWFLNIKDNTRLLLELRCYSTVCVLPGVQQPVLGDMIQLSLSDNWDMTNSHLMSCCLLLMHNKS